VAELDDSTWTTENSEIIAENNFAFDQNGQVVSINSAINGAIGLVAPNFVDWVDRGGIRTFEQTSMGDVGVGIGKWLSNVLIGVANLGIQAAPGMGLTQRLAGQSIAIPSWEYSDGEIGVAAALDVTTLVAGPLVAGIRRPEQLAAVDSRSSALYTNTRAALEADLAAEAAAAVRLRGEIAANSGKALQGNLSDVWRMRDTARGTAIESHLAVTEYKDWFNVGQLNNGKFPLVDFQNGSTLVSLKSVNTNGSTWMTRMQDHIYDLGRNGATVSGRPATMVLDVRVQPGGLKAAQPLINYGRQNGVTVIIKEFK
jgi:hypothetical protein